MRLASCWIFWWLLLTGLAVGITALTGWPSSTLGEMAWGGSAGIVAILAGNLWRTYR